MSGFEREDDEIVRYYDSIKAADVFGIWGTELLMRVPLSKASPLMKENHGWDEESWSKAFKRKDKESLIEEMEDYFQFATEKAVMHRGRSASQAIVHYLAWSWLMGDMELMGYLIESRNYPNYGCPMLLAVAQKYEFMDLMPTNPVDHAVFFQMAQGKVCSPLCNGGCGLGAPGQFRPLGVIMPPTAKAPGLVLS